VGIAKKTGPPRPAGPISVGPLDVEHESSITEIFVESFVSISRRDSRSLGYAGPMSHAICALVIVGNYDRDIAGKIDLRAIATYQDVSVMPIDHFYSTFWAADSSVGGELDVPMHVPATFPRDKVLLQFMRDMTGKPDPKFAIIQTAYDEGKSHHNGEQWAAAFQGPRRISTDHASINDALRAIGVGRRYPKDEFDTIGLAAFWSNPRHLEKYRSWCTEHEAQGVVQAAVVESLSERVHAMWPNQRT
jgi:hypothetical protein